MLAAVLSNSSYAHASSVSPATAETRIETESRVSTSPSKLKHPRVGLALGGGGSRGAAHIGVLRVLIEEGVPINCVTGTSMGSVVGGLFAAGVPVNEIEDKFTSGRLMKAFLPVPLSVRVASIPLFYLPYVVGVKQMDGIYSGKEFATFLNKSVSEQDRDLSKLKIPFGAVSLNLLDGRVYTLTKGDFGRALQASSAVPFLKKPVSIDGQLFVDGGVTANIPVQQARGLGADLVIAVDVDEPVDQMPPEDLKEPGSVVHRVLTMHLATHDAGQNNSADVVIHPNVNGIGLITTKEKELRQAIAAGEQAARQAMPTIKSKLESQGIELHPRGASSLSQTGCGSL